MLTITPYSLTFDSGLHLGTRGVNLEEAGLSIPSDTLYAALIDVWSRSEAQLDGLLQPFIDASLDPPFLLSSAFPQAGQVRFYPMPIDRSRLFNRTTLKAQNKTIKRIRYLSEGLLEIVLKGDGLDAFLFPDDETINPTRGAALQRGSLWLTVEEIERLPRQFHRPADKWRSLRYMNVWASERVPRVTISRISSTSNIFHSGKVRLAEDCSLWFGVQWRALPAKQNGNDLTDYQQAFERALAMLQDDGLGGERTSGYGAFRYQVQALKTLPEAVSGKPAYLISRYHPRQDELPTALTGRGAAYTLLSVSGWLHTMNDADQRRKGILLVPEGSLIRYPGFPAGDFSDVRPVYGEKNAAPFPHPVWRAGLALAIGWPSTD